MMLWLVAAVTAAVTVPGLPPPGPHMHYEIRINGISQPLTDDQRLHSACDLAGAVEARVQKQAKDDLVLAFDLAVLKNLTCNKPKSN